MAAKKHSLEDLRNLHGITVELAQEFPDLPFSSYRVEGPGYTTMLRCTDKGFGFDSDDQATLNSLADPNLHADRFKPPPPPAPPPPTLEQKLTAELDKLDAKKATVEDMLKAVKGALK
jgi:hypothetical protein